MNTPSPLELSATKQALLKIRELKLRLAAAESHQAQKIAVVSMACRFPKSASTPETFWQSLLNEECQIDEIPNSRWDLEAFYSADRNQPGAMYARHGAFLESVDSFDPEFFGISPREATWIDPQQRLLMETSWEAFERAGWKPHQTSAKTGVFIGWMHNDYQNEASDSFLNLNPYIATGAAGSFLPGRLAYSLGLEGPTLAIDTACSSSLVALHLACQSLSMQECDRALVGGVNVIASPTTTILTCKLQALSVNGWSRAFDASADGYVRGEGCGVIALKRLSDAIQDNDPILGVVEATAVGHNGLSSGLTVPNPKAQQRVIQDALNRANLSPAQIDYLEAHGTGTELGDPIELNAAAEILGKNRSYQTPLLIGSVKTNIGHLEAASGIAGFIKALLAINHKTIPAHLGLEVPNPHIDWEKLPVKVVTQQTAWPDQPVRYAGVSAFGMSGTNAHAILSSYDSSPQRGTHRVGNSSNGQLASASSSNAVAQFDNRNRIQSGNGVHRDQALQQSSNPQAHAELIVLSARNQQALAELTTQYQQWYERLDEVDFPNSAFTTRVGRSHFAHRIHCVASHPLQAAEKLSAILERRQSTQATSQPVRQTPKVLWQFSGQGAQFEQMASGLYRQYSVFKDVIDQCEELLTRHQSQSLIHVLQDQSDLIHQTQWTQPALFAVEMGLARLLQSWGLHPDLVMGHSVGQYAAACVAGLFTLEEGFCLIAERGRLIGSLPHDGSMYAVFAQTDRLNDHLTESPAISIAARNGSHTVLSGRTAELETLISKLSEAGLKSKRLKTSHAFHSALMDPILDPFEQFATDFEFKPLQVPLLCNLTGELLSEGTQLTAEYWARHIRGAVEYQKSIHTASEHKCDLILELGPQAILTGMARSVWKGRRESLISCLEKSSDDQFSLLSTIGQLYEHGVTPDFELMPHRADAKCLVTPTYPFQRTRYWGPAKPKAAHASAHTAHPLLLHTLELAGAKDERRFETIIESDSPAWLVDHQVMQSTVFPGAGYLEMAFAALQTDTLEHIEFQSQFRPSGRTQLQTCCRKDETQTQRVEIFSKPVSDTSWTQHFSCRAASENTKSMASPPQTDWLERVRQRMKQSCDPTTFYETLAEVGLNYGNSFQTVRSLQFSETEVLARIELQSDALGYRFPPMLLDGALHCLAAGLVKDRQGDLYLPVAIEQMSLLKKVPMSFWCHGQYLAEQSAEQKPVMRLAQITLYDDHAEVFATIRNLSLKRLDRKALQALNPRRNDKHLYQIVWEPFTLNASDITPGTWLIYGRDSQLVQSIKSKLSTAGQFTIEFDPDSVGTLDLTTPPDGVIWCCSSSMPEQDPLRQLQAEIKPLIQLRSQLQQQGVNKLACGWQMVTQSAVHTSRESQQMALNPVQSSLWGFGRSFAAEQPGMQVRLIDLDSSSDASLDQLCRYIVNDTSENQIAIRNKNYFVPRLKAASQQTESQSLRIDSGSSYLITGGLGSLGLMLAQWLADQGAGEIILVSRRAPSADVASTIEQLNSSGSRVVIHQADVTDSKAMESLFQRFGNDLKPLKGVFHTAGLLDDGLLADQTWERFARVLSPKLKGVETLEQLVQQSHCELDLFVVYSSAASVLGSPGQTSYSLANGYLDGLITRRRQQGQCGLSLNWGPWSAGMAADEMIRKRMQLQGIIPLQADQAHELLQRAIETQMTQTLVIDADWSRMKASLGERVPPFLSQLVGKTHHSVAKATTFVTELKQLSDVQQRERLTSTVQKIFQSIFATSDLPQTDRPLIEMGMDSLMAVEFSTQLQELLGDSMVVVPTLLFDHHTIDAIAEFVIQELNQSSAQSGDSKLEQGDSSQSVSPQTIAPQIEPQQAFLKEPVAIVGMSCRFPGAESLEQFWQNLLEGVDSVGQMPDDRWDVERFYSESPKKGKIPTREGGFLHNIAEFDAEFFGIKKTEACWLDPQHRLLLENSWHALEDAAIDPNRMADRNVGIFMGIMSSDYAFLPSLENQQLVEQFQGAGFSHSAGVGRISHFFQFEGPSVSVDTASSSSLVAVLQAVRSLQNQECRMALAGGVNAILVPANSLLMANAGLLARDGRCKSFSAQADGFGRGEGCGVVVLKRLSDAIADGDRIDAVIRGGAIAHNGISGTITTPNGQSQTKMIKAALEDARIAPKQVQYLEAHGTGTEFGDPIELTAANAVFSRGRKRTEPLLVGSVKANISHLEAAGGISGLIKTVLCLKHKIIPRQLHFDQPSPHIPWNKLLVSIVQDTIDWPESSERIAAVTALGLAGTNASLLLSGHDDQSINNDTSTTQTGKPQLPQLLLLSAPTAEGLSQVAQTYLQFIEQYPEMNLEHLCQTALAGRVHHSHRLAVVVEDRASLLSNLKMATGHKSDAACWYRGADKSTSHTTLFLTTLGSSQLNELPSLLKTSAKLDQSIRQSVHLWANQEDQSLVDAIYPTLCSWLEGDCHFEQLPEQAARMAEFFAMHTVVKLLESFEIKADLIAGHGLGQYVCAVAAGMLSVETALQLIARRDSVDPTEFERFADTLNYFPPNRPILCSVEGELISAHKVLGGSYWSKQREFELNPSELKSRLQDHFDSTVIDSAFKPEGSLTEQITHLVAQEYCRGKLPRFHSVALSSPARMLTLPTYPFQRKRYWITDLMHDQPFNAKEQLT